MIWGTGSVSSRAGACIDPPIPRSRSGSVLLACVWCVVCVCSEDVESGLTATRCGTGGGGEGERDLEEVDPLWTAEPEPEKRRGVSHDAGAVADRRLSFSFLLAACVRASFKGLVARRVSGVEG